jgi:hypothetical protein
MITEILTPAAWAEVRWLSSAAGGRRSGPPTAPVYAANCAFPLGGEAELVPGWPATAEKYSLLLQKLAERDDGTWSCALDFLARDLVAAAISCGGEILVMEGPKVVARGVVIEIDEQVLRGY